MWKVQLKQNSKTWYERVKTDRTVTLCIISTTPYSFDFIYCNGVLTLALLIDEKPQSSKIGTCCCNFPFEVKPFEVSKTVFNDPDKLYESISFPFLKNSMKLELSLTLFKLDYYKIFVGLFHTKLLTVSSFKKHVNRSFVLVPSPFVLLFSSSL